MYIYLYKWVYCSISSSMASSSSSSLKQLCWIFIFTFGGEFLMAQNVLLFLVSGFLVQNPFNWLAHTPTHTHGTHNTRTRIHTPKGNPSSVGCEYNYTNISYLHIFQQYFIFLISFYVFFSTDNIFANIAFIYSSIYVYTLCRCGCSLHMYMFFCIYVYKLFFFTIFCFLFCSWNHVTNLPAILVFHLPSLSLMMIPNRILWLYETRNV